jgi:hypothetical protein
MSEFAGFSIFSENPGGSSMSFTFWGFIPNLEVTGLGNFSAMTDNI